VILYGFTTLNLLIHATQINLCLSFLGWKCVVNSRMKYLSAKISSEMEFCNMDPWKMAGMFFSATTTTTESRPRWTAGSRRLKGCKDKMVFVSFFVEGAQPNNPPPKKGGKTI
jgi:hypothetical protein